MVTEHRPPIIANTAAISGNKMAIKHVTAVKGAVIMTFSLFEKVSLLYFM